MEDGMQDHRFENSWCKILIQNNFAETLDTKDENSVLSLTTTKTDPMKKDDIFTYA